MEKKIRHKEYHWHSFDRTVLFAQSWEPAEQKKAVICLVHGLGDHSARHIEWVQKFVENGYAVLAVDLRGHGHSKGKRGYARAYSHLINDVGVLIKKAHKLFPGLPRILYGYSMGGNLALYYQMKRRTKISGMIITSPWLKLLNEPSGPCLFLGKIITKICPKFTIKSTVKKEGLTNSAEEMEKLADDPYTHDKVSIGLFFGVKQAGEFILKNKHKINIPLLIIHGDKDKIVSWKSSRKLAKNTNSRTTLKIWEGGYHELHHAKESNEVLSFIISWMDKQGFYES